MKRPKYTVINNNDDPLYYQLALNLRGSGGRCKHSINTPILCDIPFAAVQPITISISRHEVLASGRCFGRGEATSKWISYDDTPIKILSYSSALECIGSIKTGVNKWNGKECHHNDSLYMSGIVRINGESSRRGSSVIGEGKFAHIIACSRCHEYEIAYFSPSEFVDFVL